MDALVLAVVGWLGVQAPVVNSSQPPQEPSGSPSQSAASPTPLFNYSRETAQGIVPLAALQSAEVCAQTLEAFQSRPVAQGIWVEFDGKIWVASGGGGLRQFGSLAIAG